jgi:2-dehydropantoate 2-reductase
MRADPRLARLDAVKVAVVGAGGVGSVFGGRLAAAGHEVWLVHRRHEMVDAVLRDGLRFDSSTGVEHIPVHATDAPAAVGPVDVALILTKATDTPAAAAAAAGMLGSDDFVAVTLQNGLGNVETIARAVGRERVLLGMTYVGATVLGPGHVRHTAQGQSFLGEPFADNTPTPSPRVERLARLLSEAGLPTVATNRVWDLAWGKLLINASMNAICALTGSSGEAALGSDSCRELLGLVARETAAVAAALGISLPYPDAAERVWQHCSDVAASKPSMLQDFERNRPTEIDAINGAVAREGARLGIPTPYNQALLLLVRAHEDVALRLAPAVRASGPEPR